MNKIRQKWLELQSWEDRYDCVVFSTIDIDSVRKDRTFSGEYTDSQILNALQDAMQCFEDELYELEAKVTQLTIDTLLNSRNK